MAHLPNDHLPGPWFSESRFTIGVKFEADGSRVTAALVRFDDAGVRARPTIVGAVSENIRQSIGSRFTALRETSVSSIGEFYSLGLWAAEIAANLVQRLTAAKGGLDCSVLALGLQGLEIWLETADGSMECLSLCDPTRLAELTGLNVIHDFAARDLAHGGRGGPLSAMGQWLFLADRRMVPGRRIRGVLDIGRTTRFTLLSASRGGQELPFLHAIDIGPGSELMDRIVQKNFPNTSAVDKTGHLAVQGTPIRFLLETWLEKWYETPREWSSTGVPVTSYLDMADQLAAVHNWSWGDILCTANRFVATCIGRVINHQLPKSQPVGEIVLSGEGRSNGMLIGEIHRQVPLPLRNIDEFSIADSHFDAASVAALALLNVDQVPANPIGLTGANVPRVLGHICAGSPSNWQFLVHEIAIQQARTLPLRFAI